MTKTSEIINMGRLDRRQFKSWPFAQDECLACGLCSSLCPVSGIDGYDPRKIVRMVELGQIEELLEARWLWLCTMCSKCVIFCPMEINMSEIVRSVRMLWDREKVPGDLHTGLVRALKTGNINALTKQEYVARMEAIAEEIAEEPGFEGFQVPIDKKGANLLLTVHNKLVIRFPEDMKHLWKLLYLANEDWTITSENQEGSNWGYFNGDDPAAKILVGRIVDHMEKLKIKNLLWPE
jgi:heterodisulfide reductase subunit C